MKQQYNIPVLKDTSLCAIVRDEEMNPAGGIRDYLHCVLPFIEQAIVVDTGSVDGTRQILEEMQGQYKNLKVFDHAFDGFAQSRNSVFDYIKKNNLGTKYSLFLDADERIPREGFDAMQKLLSCSSAYDDEDGGLIEGYHIPIKGVSSRIGNSGGHNPRLIVNQPGNYFYNNEGLVFEWICNRNGRKLYNSYFDMESSLSNEIMIYHFLPDSINEGKKQWYEHLKTLLPSDVDIMKDPNSFDVSLVKTELNEIRLCEYCEESFGPVGYEYSLSNSYSPNETAK